MQQPAPTPAEPAISAEQAADNSRHAAELLRDLMDRAHELAQMIHQKAVATAMDAVIDGTYLQKSEDFTVTFERAARTVRRCIILLEKLAEPRPTAYDLALAAQKRTPARIHPGETPAPQRSDTEQTERAERSENVNDEFGNEFATRPIGEIVGEICTDLGLPPPAGTSGWSHQTLDTIAAATTDPNLTRSAPARLALVPASDAPSHGDPAQPPYPLRL